MKKSLIFRLYKWFKQVCKTLGKDFRKFRYLEKVLDEFEKTIRLFNYTREWLIKKKFSFTVIDGINYPTVDTIKKLHDFLVVKYERDINKIHKGEYSLAPLNFEGIKYWMTESSNREDDIVLRGAHVFNKFLEEGHPFVDGNKRTGWATLWIFLASNGYLFFFPTYFRESKQVEKIECWADGKRSSDNITEIVDWIKKYIKKI